eukprot:3950555-Pyramimonas_sp.AAC.1
MDGKAQYTSRRRQSKRLHRLANPRPVSQRTNNRLHDVCDVAYITSLPIIANKSEQYEPSYLRWYRGVPEMCSGVDRAPQEQQRIGVCLPVDGVGLPARSFSSLSRPAGPDPASWAAVRTWNAAAGCGQSRFPRWHRVLLLPQRRR